MFINNSVDFENMICYIDDRELVTTNQNKTDGGSLWIKFK